MTSELTALADFFSRVRVDDLLMQLGDTMGIAAIERAAKLGNRAVEGVERETGRRAVGQRQRRFLDASQRAFGDEPNSVDERVTSHQVILHLVIGSFRDLVV